MAYTSDWTRLLEMYHTWVERDGSSVTPEEKYKRIKASIREELGWNRANPARGSVGNRSETRGSAIRLGKLAKALGLQ